MGSLVDFSIVYDGLEAIQLFQVQGLIVHGEKAPRPAPPNWVGPVSCNSRSESASHSSPGTDRPTGALKASLRGSFGLVYSRWAEAVQFRSKVEQLKNSLSAC